MIVIMQRSSTLFLAELRCQRLTYIKAFRHTNPHLHVTATAIIPHATHATVNESLIVRSYTYRCSITLAGVPSLLRQINDAPRCADGELCGPLPALH